MNIIQVNMTFRDKCLLTKQTIYSVFRCFRHILLHVTLTVISSYSSHGNNWKTVKKIYYEGRSKSSRKSATIFLFCKSAELNYYSYIDNHYLYLCTKFCCSGMNTMLIVVAMETVHHDYRPTFVNFCKKSMFNDDVAFDSLPCCFH